MADQLYLSLWFPNFRFAALPEALVGVLRQFALISGDKRVAAASAYPLGFSESPTYQRLYVHDERAEETPGSLIEAAVAEATEQLHEDMAYEFEMKWQLWAPVVEGAPENLAPAGHGSDEEFDRSEEFSRDALLDPTWKQQPATVRILGFGPQFDDASFDQNGHIRVDFGLDTPWLQEDAELDETATRYIQKNIEMLLAFTLSVEKHCGISSRLLWTESGEPLAQKLVERLQRVN
jgi:hypothetical protein